MMTALVPTVIAHSVCCLAPTGGLSITVTFHCMSRAITRTGWAILTNYKVKFYLLCLIPSIRLSNIYQTLCSS